jgi:hypothetical protein
VRSTSIASRRPRKRSGLVGGDSKAFVVWRSAFSDFASSSETPEATSDKQITSHSFRAITAMSACPSNHQSLFTNHLRSSGRTAYLPTISISRSAFNGARVLTSLLK